MTFEIMKSLYIITCLFLVIVLAILMFWHSFQSNLQTY